MYKFLPIVDATGETRMKIEKTRALMELILNAYYTNDYPDHHPDDQATYNMDTLLGLVLESLKQAEKAERIAEELLEASKQTAQEGEMPMSGDCSPKG